MSRKRRWKECLAESAAGSPCNRIQVQQECTRAVVTCNLACRRRLVLQHNILKPALASTNQILYCALANHHRLLGWWKLILFNLRILLFAGFAWIVVFVFYRAYSVTFPRYKPKLRMTERPGVSKSQSFNALYQERCISVCSYRGWI
ncbi:Alpha-glucosides permease MPH3 [Fusarium oxysporum f. sp. albedinis]|nr:Alpha-glucosides permease MPH3 [Fusarium oxysporum f. sp. albedinis]